MQCRSKKAVCRSDLRSNWRENQTNSQIMAMQASMVNQMGRRRMNKNAVRVLDSEWWYFSPYHACLRDLQQMDPLTGAEKTR